MHSFCVEINQYKTPRWYSRKPTIWKKNEVLGKSTRQTRQFIDISQLAIFLLQEVRDFTCHRIQLNKAID